MFVYSNNTYNNTTFMYEKYYIYSIVVQYFYLIPKLIIGTRVLAVMIRKTQLLHC